MGYAEFKADLRREWEASQNPPAPPDVPLSETPITPHEPSEAPDPPAPAFSMEDLAAVYDGRCFF